VYPLLLIPAIKPPLITAPDRSSGAAVVIIVVSVALMGAARRGEGLVGVLSWKRLSATVFVISAIFYVIF
jgi:hypothetical protein